MKIQELFDQAQVRWPGQSGSHIDSEHNVAELFCEPRQVPLVCDWIFNELGYHFAGLVVEEWAKQWDVWYIFVGEGEAGRILVRASAPFAHQQFQTISRVVHAADWHERVAEDLFGVVFAGHPELGDFILHDDVWGEGVAPMRKSFDASRPITNRQPRRELCPRRIVKAPGSFIMPIGPVFSAEAESVHFQLETIGEEVISVLVRLFFKYRGLEKIAEGRSVDNVLLLAERFAGTTAFSHGLAFCESVEQIAMVKVPERAQYLRVFLAELERFRHHLGVIAGVCNSTGLAVADSQAAILEEEALRLSGKLTGHRYLFGLPVPGGLSCDLSDEACREAARQALAILQRLNELEQMLKFSSSFLDRIENVGIITAEQARSHGLVGPVGRGSGYCFDLRRIQPYSAYNRFNFEVPCEQEGDGYARLRVWFAEARQSVRILEQVASQLPGGSIYAPCEIRPGVALSGVETPRGATYHWVRIDEQGKISRYRPITPSCSNWHGFHLAAENFAFQDFPIILATFGLSVAENDR
jgi:Ni,Fe-hydrogenase III large subunit/NADH:ubiquinone oxidoreductase subunit C